MARKQRETPANASSSAVIYTRVTSEEQEREGVSLAAQLVNCRRYCAAQGWGIEVEFQDVLSGTRDDRPHYQAMLARVRELRAEGRDIAIVCMWLRKWMRMEDCLEGPLLGNHETQLQTRKWRTHEQP